MPNTLDSQAVARRRAHDRQRYRDNPKRREYLNASAEKRRAAKREQAREYMRVKRAAMTEAEKQIRLVRERQRDRERYTKNPARQEYQLTYRSKHLERCRALARNRQKAHPEVGRLGRARRRAKIRRADGRGWTLQDVARQCKAQRGKCYYCGKFMGEQYQCEHVIPLALGGRHCRSNLVLACPGCNYRKGAQDPQVFAGILL